MRAVEIGTIVRFEAPGSRSSEGVARLIPAVVLRQWEDGSLQLYALHFEGSFLVNSIPVRNVEILLEPAVQRPVVDLEKEKPPATFSLLHDTH